MNHDRAVEYRAVWPNGVVIEGVVQDDKEEFFQWFDDFVLGLKNQGVPKEYCPRVECRIIEKVHHDWRSYGEVEVELRRANEGPRHVVQPNPDPSANGQIVTTWGEPTPQQIERVRRRQFGWGDPCVICGTRFIDCPHDGNVTEAFVTMVKRRYL